VVSFVSGPNFKKAQSALEKGFGKKAVFIREGGSIPFVTQIYDTFKVPCVLIGFGLPDENAHAPDEHIALENISAVSKPSRTSTRIWRRFEVGLLRPTIDQ